jgi:hypothetical protein
VVEEIHHESSETMLCFIRELISYDLLLENLLTYDLNVDRPQTSVSTMSWT